ncbi:MAG: bifunctional 4-hydroxy-2-oxoglutarate aldolase/2-dehydro-3-deoxy-phosphogluconate aldolase, partial [Oscillospiraceae bacterium]|nr:bifunctional 4-hydroxy-2-oxoglutarate aldolase/2-dehydro-3-deoxy-phosphogluconate aldolase [Oscillospiraceae bacterium]
MNNLTDIIYGTGLVPVIALNDHTKAASLAKALCAGGIPVAEVTFRTDSALQVMKEMTQNVPEIIVGAGTVHSVEQAQSAIDAGAKFIVTPGFAPAVVKWCINNHIPVFPGCSSASDIEAAIELGLKTVKFFPAESSGGVKSLKALAGPYYDIKFMPTGGINENNVGEYLSLDNVVACGGSWMVPQDLIEKDDFAQITSLCKEAVRKAFGFELLHVGVNTKDAADASNVANGFADLLSLPIFEYPGAFFAGTLFEIVKGPFLGDNGHIAIQT